MTVRELRGSRSFNPELDPISLLKVLAPGYFLRVRDFRRSLDSLAGGQFPMIAECVDGTFIVLAARAQNEWVIVDPQSPQPRHLGDAELRAQISGRFAHVREARDMPEVHRAFGMSWLTRRAARLRGLVAQILLASLAMQIFAIAMPLFSQVVIDKVLVHHNPSALYVLGVGMGGLTVFEFVLMLMRTQQQAHIASKVELELGVRVKQKLMSLPLQYFHRRSSGHLLGLFKELDTVRQFITGPSATSMVDVTFLAVFLPLMVLYSPKLTGVTVLTALAMVGMSALLKPGMTRHMETQSRATTESQSRLVENLAGIGTIKALAAERVMQRRWESAFALNVLTTLQSANAQGLVAAASTFIQRLSMLGVLWAGADLVLKNEISVGQMIAFQMLSARVLHPMMRMSQLVQEMRQVGHAMARLSDIMNAPSEEAPSDRRLGCAPEVGALEVEKLCFSYSANSRPILRELTLRMSVGKSVAIVGKSGSGKSSLVKVLIGLFDAQRGCIRYNGVDIRNIDRAALRKRIALVPQDAELFFGTIAQNIAIHSPWVSLERIVEAARNAGADSFIEELDNGYQTVIGSGGQQLSGGQRQRLTLARALLGEPDVLILDEATSALDFATEALVLDKLCRLFRDRILIVVTHRLHAVRNFDAIHLLVGGALEESGTHAELVERPGPYRALYEEATA